MKEIDHLLKIGCEVMFAYVCSGEMAEFIKCEIELPGNGYCEGFGENSFDAFQQALARMSEKD